MKVVTRLFVVLAVVIVFSELLLRAGIAFHVAWLREPGLYFDWTSDDDYWKLRHLWGRKVTSSSPEMMDPFLGWVTPKTSENPLGAIAPLAYVPDYRTKNILFFGDIFIQGGGIFTGRIPAQVEKLVGTTPVYNMGMKGYGLDQTYLRTQRDLLPFVKPTAVIGITTVGLDRSYLSFRTGPKPYFLVQDNKLVVRGVPIDPDASSWLAKYPPEVGTFLGNFLIQRQRRFSATNELESSYRREAKKELNAKILEAMNGELRARQIPTLYVLFYTEEEMRYEGWREKFLKEAFKHLRENYVDSKPLLLREARQQQVKVGSFYEKEGFLNARGNKVVADAITTQLRNMPEVATRSQVN